LDVIATYREDAFESDAFAASEPPELKELRTFPQRKAFAFLEKKDPEQARREAEKAAAFEAKMSTDRRLHEEGHLAKDAVEAAGLLEQLEQPAAEKAKEKPKEAKDWTCKYTGCNVKYPDATSSGASRKYNYGFCSSECRELMRKAPRAPPTQCKHGHQKSRCKDCGTGYCKHGRQKHQRKDCGTGYCQHGRLNHRCKDCGRQ
jgi:hypothetical protein